MRRTAPGIIAHLVVVAVSAVWLTGCAIEPQIDTPRGEDHVQPGVEQLLGSSLLPDPDERRLRREHALAGELAATLRELPGVAAARVHLSLPTANGFGREPTTPGRAVVVLRADPGTVPEAGEIALLAAGAVPGLPAGNVEVRIHAEPVACPELIAIGSVRVTRDTATMARIGVAVLLLTCLGLAAGMLFVGLRLRRSRSGRPVE